MADQTFESKFAKMAGVQLNEKLPSLLPYNVGFQLIDKNDEETQAKGIHAFVINGLWVYVPVFFLQGKLKGTDIMYLKQQDLVVPAMDNWISTLKKQGSNIPSLGKAKKIGKGSNTPEDVNLDEMEFNSIGKVAADTANMLMLPDEIKKMLTMDTCHSEWPLGLMEQLKKLPSEVMEIFANTLSKSPQFSNAVLQHHTPDEIGTLAGMLQNSTKAEVEAEIPTVKIIIDIQSKEAKELPDKAKEQLLRNGMYIIDERPEHSILFRDKLAADKVKNVTDNGVYDIIMRDGSTKKFLVVRPEIDGATWRLLISFDSPKKCRRVWDKPLSGPGLQFRGTYVSELIGTPVDNVDQLEKLRGNLGDTLTKRKCADLGSDDTYNSNAGVLIQIDDVRGGTFRVIDVTGFTKDGKLRVSTGRGGDMKAVIPVFQSTGRLSIHGDTILIPENTRWFVRECEHGDNFADQFATPEGVIARMGKEAGLTPLTVTKAGERVFIDTLAGGRTPVMDKAAAVRELAETHGIAGGQAMQLLNEALRDKRCSYLVKYASTARIPHKIDYNNHNKTKRYNSQTLLPQEAIQMATESAASGNTQVFDVTVLQSLMQLADIGDAKKDFLTDMVRGMDRCGRLLMMYYCNYENFAERYGEENMQNIESKIKQVFKNTGDLILFLKEKSSSYGDLPEDLFGTLSEDIG